MRFCYLFFILIYYSSYSQVYYGSEAALFYSNADEIRFSNNNELPSYIHFYNSPTINDLENWMKQYFDFSNEIAIYPYLKKTEINKKGSNHYRYYQTYNAIPIHDANFIIHTNSGFVESINGRLYKNIVPQNSIVLTEEDALQFALNFVNAKVYMWQIAGEDNVLKEILNDSTATFYPKGEIMLVPLNYTQNSNQHYYVYRFKIYAQTPLSHKEIYIDAENGKVRYDFDLLHPIDVPGTAVTKYSGTQTIIANRQMMTYKLKDFTRGLGIETYNMMRQTTYANAIDFTDDDNYWNNRNEFFDEVATDAHWGCEKTYDYLLLKHNYNSIDNAGYRLRNYVHYDVQYANAFWDGIRMTYGDGNAIYLPFCPIDIIAHEITHGLTQKTANLIYSGEQGALSEAFSDIFGCSVEFFAKPNNANWTIGENIGPIIRNLSNPKAQNLPNTYLGTYWYIGTNNSTYVHNNCGPIIYWYYLLCQGGSGINDNQQNYSVSPIGISKAEQITFRVLTVYLINNSNFLDFAFYAKKSAADLYGLCSPEYQSVVNALYAVGISEPYSDKVTAKFSSNLTQHCSTPATINFFNNSINSTSVMWDFGDGTFSTLDNPAHTYSNYGSYTVKLFVNGGGCGTDSIVKKDYVSISPGLFCNYIMPKIGNSPIFNICRGILYDDGGELNYSNNVRSFFHIAPQYAASVNLTVLDFDFETINDSIVIFNGIPPTMNIIGVFKGNDLKKGMHITSTTPTISISQNTNSSIVRSGFKFYFACNNQNTKPVAYFTVIDSLTCNGEIECIDMSSNFPTFWQWDFGDGTVSFEPNPKHTYLKNGVYSIKLVVKNSFGVDSILKSNIVKVQRPPAPVINDTIVKDSAIITYNTNFISSWFEVPIGGTAINIGTTFTTPVLEETKTYFVESMLPTPIYSCGKPDTSGGLKDNNSVSGNQYLLFNCYKNIVLKSVLVYSTSERERLIELRNKNNELLYDTIILIPKGAQRLVFNWFLPMDNNYRLICANSSTFLLSNYSGVIPYPFRCNNLLEIVGCSSSLPGAYSYFYDWQIYEASPCISERVPVTITVLHNDTIMVFPNPVRDILKIYFSNSENKIYEIELLDMLGRRIYILYNEFLAGSFYKEIPLFSIRSGVYILRIYSPQRTVYTSKIIVN